MTERRIQLYWEGKGRRLAMDITENDTPHRGGAATTT